MKKLRIFIIVVAYLCSIALILYPIAAYIINNIYSQNQITQYNNTVKELPENEAEIMLKKAKEYNKTLYSSNLDDPFSVTTDEELDKEYNSLLNVDGNGTMGYIQIPSIGVNLPIKHGTSEEVLSKGAGHLQGTSLPVGGIGTHSVISAHSGFPRKTLFNYLQDVKKGDYFYITVLNQTLKYEVDQIVKVEPDDNSQLLVNPKEDYVTLVTCTPIGINSHRLLVRGTRVPYNGEDASSIIKPDDGYFYLFGYKIPYWALWVALGVIVVIIIVVVIILIKKRKKKKQKQVISETNEESCVEQVRQE